MRRLTDEDLLLIAQAQAAIGKNYDHLHFRHTVGAAIRTRGGKVYTGVNVYLNHGACAEVIALGTAITAGERTFDCVAAVRGEGEVLPPCGNCRQMLFEYAPDCDVITPSGEGCVKVKAAELLPCAYTRGED